MTSLAMPRLNGIPALGLGTYPLAGEQAESAVRMALELGLRHIDTAQMYGNEAAIGRAIRASGVARDELFIVTKVDPSNLGPDRFAASVGKSIADLGLTPDLLLIHWPPADSDLDATVLRLVAERDKGNARLIGVSNFTVAMMRRAQELAQGSIICNQVEFHPLLDQSRLLAAARELGMVLTAYSPLARGKALRPRVIEDIAARHGRPPSEIVLGWIFQQGVAAIPMTTKLGNARSNADALGVTLSEEEMAAISGLGTRQGRTISPSWMAGRWD